MSRNVWGKTSEKNTQFQERKINHVLRIGYLMQPHKNKLRSACTVRAG